MKQTHFFVIFLCLFIFYSQVSFSRSTFETSSSKSENENDFSVILMDKEEYNEISIDPINNDIAKLYDSYKYSIDKDEVLVQSSASHYQPYYYNMKNPALAVFLSLLLPGGGQYYNGQYVKGAVMTGLHIGTGVLIIAGIIQGTNDGAPFRHSNTGGSMIVTGLILNVCNYVWSIIDAPFCSIIINNKIQMGERAFLNIKPDYSLTNISPTIGSKTKLHPTFGMKVSLTL